MATRKWLAVTIFFLSFPSQAKAQFTSFDILTPEVKQGGTAVIRVHENIINLLGGQIVLKTFDKDYWPDVNGLVFVGVSQLTPPGKYVLYLQNNATKEKVGWCCDDLMVTDGNFPEKPWPFKRSRKATPEETKKRKQERVIIDNALDYFYRDSQETYIDGKFELPLDKIEVREGFGVKRVSRGVLVEQHGGVDLRTNDPTNPRDKKPKPIKSTNSGKVVLAQKLSAEGNFVIIYHGKGIFSLYMHMSRLKVKSGQFIKSGQIIGLSGKTGHVTGPHLDFRIKINGSYVDPLIFIETANKYLE